MTVANLFQALTLTAALLLSATHAFAAEPEHPHTACKVDVEKFCKDIKPGGGRIIQCLKSHAAELSPTCSAAFAEKKVEVTAAIADCRPDAVKFCAGIKPGEGRILACLKSHEAELTPVCKAHFGPKTAPTN